MPMSAWRSAGASLTPSPVIATTSPSDWSALAIRSLSSGATRARTQTDRSARSCRQVARRRQAAPTPSTTFPSSRPASGRPTRAVAGWSPVIISTRIPASRRAPQGIGHLRTHRVRHPDRARGAPAPPRRRARPAGNVSDLAPRDGEHAQPVGSEPLDVREHLRPLILGSHRGAPGVPRRTMRTQRARCLGRALHEHLERSARQVVNRAHATAARSRTGTPARAALPLLGVLRSTPPLRAMTTRAPSVGSPTQRQRPRAARRVRRCRASPPGGGVRRAAAAPRSSGRPLHGQDAPRGS